MKLLTWSLATFHTTVFVLVIVLFAYSGGGLEGALGGLNTFAGLGLFVALWATTYVTTARALRGLDLIGSARDRGGYGRRAFLWGAANGNPLNPLCAGSAVDLTTGLGKVCGGTITFGGGLALYKGQTRVGGLGVSGDTSCTDHETAKRMREAAGLAPAGMPSDDIVYAAVDGPSPFAHAMCPNTYRDGKKLGDETPADKD